MSLAERFHLKEAFVGAAVVLAAWTLPGCGNSTAYAEEGEQRTEQREIEQSAEEENSAETPAAANDDDASAQTEAETSQEQSGAEASEEPKASGNAENAENTEDKAEAEGPQYVVPVIDGRKANVNLARMVAARESRGRIIIVQYGDNEELHHKLRKAADRVHEIDNNIPLVGILRISGEYTEGNDAAQIWVNGFRSKAIIGQAYTPEEDNFMGEPKETMKAGSPGGR